MFNDLRHPLNFTLPIVFFLFVLGSSGASHAQATIDPHKAKAFVQAAIVVSRISEEWQSRINGAKSEVEAERLREQAASAMHKAIRDVDGMTVYRYRSMYYEARRDPELAAYLKDLLEQQVAGR